MIKRAWFLMSVLWSFFIVFVLINNYKSAPVEPIIITPDVPTMPVGYVMDTVPSSHAQTKGTEILLVFLVMPWLMFPAASYIRHGFTPKSLR